jgi:DMSO reductase anchor subunit
MHPAGSIIAFTTLSGLGFGLMAWLGLGVRHADGWVAAVFCLLALGLAGGGLLASLLHLGNPQRAWRALSQWRSSWLSREGVAAIATMAVFFVYGALWAFADMRIAALGWLAAALALATVWCTSMIYAQMRTVPRWRSWTTPALFLLYALAGGAMLADEIMAALVLLAALWALQVYAWRVGDGAFAASGSTIGTATGLGRIGAGRLLEGPHTSPNYLMKEMVFVVGRRRARALRWIATGLGGALPALIFALLPVLPATHALAGLAVLSHIAGVAVSRWLFFAEAEHVVGLYYGRDAA